MIPLVLMWLRAAGLIGQSLVLGGAAFALIVLPLARGTAGLEPGRLLALRLAVAGAVVVAVAELGWLACLAGAFADASGWRAGALLGTTKGAVGRARAALAIVANVRRRGETRRPGEGGNSRGRSRGPVARPPEQIDLGTLPRPPRTLR